MNKPKAQGTAWETKIVQAVKGVTRRQVYRRALSGQAHEADITIVGYGHTLRWLAVKQYEKREGKKRGSIEYVAMPLEDALALLDLDNDMRYHVYIQAKAAQNVGVARYLKGLMQWVKEHG